jgi:hypothetical protein
VFTVGAVDAKTGVAKAVQNKVTVGGRTTASKGTVWVAVLSGLKGESPVVASGAAFLADGDNVRVVKPL